MLRRSFSILPRVLKSNGKSKDIAAVSKTIKYIAEDPTLKSILKTSTGEKDENAYVEDVVNILNSSLPDVDKHKKNMDVHYSVLMNKLRGMVDREIVYSNANVSKRIKECTDADSLYNLLFEFQLDPVFRAKNTLKDYYHIINHAKFSSVKCRELLESLDLLKQSRRDIQIMAIHKLSQSSANAAVVSPYLPMLIETYMSIPRFSQKLVLRILHKNGKIQELLDAHSDEIHAIHKNHSQVVTIYQTLSRTAYKLPPHLVDESHELTPIQRLFCELVVLLSEHSSANPKLSKYSVQLVKGSFENQLSRCNTDLHDHSINVNEYKFIRLMQEILDDCMATQNLDPGFYQSCRYLTQSLRTIYTEESQLSLRLV